MTLKMKILEDFGPKTGERWTKTDAKEQGNEFRAELLILRQQVRDLHSEISNHNSKAAHDVANNRMQSVDQSIISIRTRT